MHNFDQGRMHKLAYFVWFVRTHKFMRPGFISFGITWYATMNSLFSPTSFYWLLPWGKSTHVCMYIHASYQLVDGCDQRFFFSFFLSFFLFVFWGRSHIDWPTHHKKNIWNIEHSLNRHHIGASLWCSHLLFIFTKFQSWPKHMR